MRILGRYETSMVDFQALRLFLLMMQPNVVLDIPTFWEHSINSNRDDTLVVDCQDSQFFI